MRNNLNLARAAKRARKYNQPVKAAAQKRSQRQDTETTILAAFCLLAVIVAKVFFNL